jgi:DNA (cytosine-5)-methyltransferase 1
MDIGFGAAGFKTLLALEKDPSCCKTLRANLPKHTKVFEADIRAVSGSELLDLCGLKKGDLGLLYGGPPCQSFSLAGNRGGLNDERGMLVGEFIRIVHETLPRAFVMENVKGMVNWEGGRVIEYIEDLLAKPVEWDGVQYKYDAVHQVLDAADFGVPQHRERVFIVGNRVDKEFEYPKPTHGPSSKRGRYATVAEAINALPDAEPPSDTAFRVAQTIKGRIAKHGY